ncbi:MAG: glycosyltransferase family 4 protein [Chthoniobacterales bacterium]|nr:glycosyltransferase family 4 protein [Chthoniobacterales bacterium]
MATRHRIGILHTESSRNLGGQELRILLEMEMLTSRGYDSVLAAREGSAILDEAEHRSLPSCSLPLRSEFDPASIVRIARTIRSHKIDIVNAHGSKDAWNAAIVARALGRKVVRSRHIGNPIRRNPLSRLIYGPLCDRVMVTSRAIARGMVERGVDPRRIESIPTGVDIAKFSNAAASGELRRSLGLAAHTPLVGMVSILRGDKGPQFFVRAALRLITQGCMATFVIVGDGDMRDRLTGMASSAPPQRIHFTGYRRDIPQLLKEFDVSVVPSKSTEGIPQALLQAFAAGVPVVAADVGGVNEAAINNLTARCFPVGDEVALAGAIDELLANPSSARTLADRAFDLVARHYSLPVMLDRIDALYRSVLGAPAPGAVASAPSRDAIPPS